MAGILGKFARASQGNGQCRQRGLASNICRGDVAAANSGIEADAQADVPEPTRYEGTMHLFPVVKGNRTFIEWSVKLDTAPQDRDRWRALFQSWIPDWTHSLERTLDRKAV
jgi:hypothetical protein